MSSGETEGVVDPGVLEELGNGRESEAVHISGCEDLSGVVRGAEVGMKYGSHGGR